MNIVPVGNNKRQENQGSFKYESIMNSSLFDGITKEAIGSLAEPQDKGTRDPAIDRAMQQSDSRSLNPANIEDSGRTTGVDPEQTHQDMSFGEPEAHTQTTGAPADQFIGAAPQEGQDPNPFEAERQKIRDFVGYTNFGVDLKPGNDGSLDVTLTPPQGAPVDVGGLLQALQQHLGGKWGGESTPPSSTGGPIKFKYIPQGMGAPSVDKVTKGGPPLGAPVGGGIPGGGGAGGPSGPSENQVMQTV